MRDSSNFWRFADQSGDCWIWVGRSMSNGYGRFSHKGRDWLAHRLAYTLAKGDIPAGLVIDHLCQNKMCVRPDHLEAVTQKENVQRAPLGGTAAVNATKTHCANGHPYSAANTRRATNGARVCRECDNAASRRYRARKRISA